MMATLKDIASMTGVSPSTISRVLNQHPEGQSVPDDIRSLILKTAEKLDYVKPTRRKSVGKNRIGKIMVIGWFNQERDQSIPFYSQIRQGIEIECRALGLDGSSLTFEWSDSIRTYSSLLNYDGVIVIGQNTEAESYLKDKDIPTVFIDWIPDPLRFSSVVANLEHGAEQAIAHLVNLGHQDIGYLGSTNDEQFQLPRYTSFKQYLSQRGLYQPEHVLLEGDWTANSGYAMARQCVASKNVARAYFVANDPMAIGALNGFLDAGLRIPEDVAIVGFDDIDMSQLVRPPLTTVRVHGQALGRLGLQLLGNGLSDSSLPITVTVPTRLIVRQSCGHS